MDALRGQYLNIGLALSLINTLLNCNLIRHFTAGDAWRGLAALLIGNYLSASPSSTRFRP